MGNETFYGDGLSTRMVGWTESLSVAVSRQRTADSALITKTSVISSGINTHSYSS